MIEILVVRDQDMATDITVWLDGVDVTEDCHVYDVDAGAGYDYDDWRENAEDRIAHASDGARQEVAAAYADPPGKQYIEGWPEEDE